MTDSQFNELISILRNIEWASSSVLSYLNFIQENVFALVCVSMVGLSLWIGFKVLKPYLFRV